MAHKKPILIASILALCLALLGLHTEDRGRKVAVVVGISRYILPPEGTDKAGYRSLRYAHSDAGKVAERLRTMGWEVVLLQSSPGTDESGAKKELILNALRGLKTERDDTVLFYYSGHGQRVDGQDYLVPADGLWKETAPAKWVPDTSTLLPFEDIRTIFSAMKASKRLAIFDACRAEPAEKGGGGPDDHIDQAKLGERFKVSTTGTVSYAVMFSCRPDESSWEDPEIGGGVYTDALLKSLDSGKVSDTSGTVILEALNTQIRENVRAWTEKHGRSMSPNMTSDLSDPIILGTVSTVARLNFDAKSFQVAAKKVLETARTGFFRLKGKSLEGSGSTREYTEGNVSLPGWIEPCVRADRESVYSYYSARSEMCDTYEEARKLVDDSLRAIQSISAKSKVFEGRDGDTEHWQLLAESVDFYVSLTKTSNGKYLASLSFTGLPDKAFSKEEFVSASKEILDEIDSGFISIQSDSREVNGTIIYRSSVKLPGFYPGSIMNDAKYFETHDLDADYADKALYYTPAMNSEDADKKWNEIVSSLTSAARGYRKQNADVTGTNIKYLFLRKQNYVILAILEKVESGGVRIEVSYLSTDAYR